MRVSRLSLVVVPVACARLLPGCAAPPPAGPASTPAQAVAPSAQTEPETVPSAPPAEPTSGELVLPADAGKGTFQQLEIDLVEVVEKRKMDGSEMMRATLRLRAGDKEETVQLTSDEPTLEWNGYVLEYRGGWRQEVQLKVRRAAP